MRLSFTADEAGFEADEYALVCGVAGGGHYLTFQRDAEGSSEDWGIHLEYDDQINGDYDCIAACRIGAKSLSIDLVRQLGKLASVTGFDVVLQLTPQRFAALHQGLRSVFRGRLQVLQFLECPFRVGDRVIFTPSERTRGLYQNIESFGVRLGETLVIREIKNGLYLYFDDGAGGWPWTEFTMLEGFDSRLGGTP